jgi:hypothetical protein
MADHPFSTATLLPCRKPLAACIATLFALSMTTSAIADTWTVTLCDEGSSGDSGAKTGTLRYALTNAISPAVIDMTALSCPSSKISLTTGALAFSQDTVTINGPGSSALTIDASGLPGSYGDHRVFSHTGNTKLTINSLGMTGGHVYHGVYPSHGGCVYSKADIEIHTSSISSCYAKNIGSGGAYGGGIFTYGALVFDNSGVILSYAKANVSVAFGGGAYAHGDVTMISSSLFMNSATSTSSNALGAGLFARSDVFSSNTFFYTNSATSSMAKAMGGGLYVKGKADLYVSRVRYNSTTATISTATGGGAHVVGGLKLRKTTLSSNKADGGVSLGGGALAGGFYSYYSTIDGNSATSSGGRGGAIYSNGSAVLKNSTVSNNTTDGNIGGLDLYGGDYVSKTLTVTNSTISGNSGGNLMGGMYADAGTVDIFNTTIAFNTAGVGKTTVYLAPGLAVAARPGANTIRLYSSIFAQNYYGSSESDLSTANSNPSIAGSDNLVRVAAANVPIGTSTACPLLGVLRNNGGRTSTHALLSGSPAIDAGDSINVNDYDQRGSTVNNGTALNYIRVSGPIGDLSPRADMGAYEVQQNDIVFDASFDGCASLL